jgi:hypothetical protein
MIEHSLDVENTALSNVQVRGAFSVEEEYI